MYGFWLLSKLDGYEEYDIKYVADDLKKLSNILQISILDYSQYYNRNTDQALIIVYHVFPKKLVIFYRKTLQLYTASENERVAKFNEYIHKFSFAELERYQANQKNRDEEYALDFKKFEFAFSPDIHTQEFTDMIKLDTNSQEMPKIQNECVKIIDSRVIQDVFNNDPLDKYTAIDIHYNENDLSSSAKHYASPEKLFEYINKMIKEPNLKSVVSPKRNKSIPQIPCPISSCNLVISPAIIYLNYPDYIK